MPRTPELNEACTAAVAEHMDADLFQALCDPVRIALVAHLASSGQPLTVTEASQCCGIHFSGVSRHLALLRRAGVVRAEKRGREMFYALEASALVSTLRGLADAVETCWAESQRAAS